MTKSPFDQMSTDHDRPRAEPRRRRRAEHDSIQPGEITRVLNDLDHYAGRMGRWSVHSSDPATRKKCLAHQAADVAAMGLIQRLADRAGYEPTKTGPGIEEPTRRRDDPTGAIVLTPSEDARWRGIWRRLARRFRREAREAIAARDQALVVAQTREVALQERCRKLTAIVKRVIEDGKAVREMTLEAFEEMRTNPDLRRPTIQDDEEPEVQVLRDSCQCVWPPSKRADGDHCPRCGGTL